MKMRFHHQDLCRAWYWTALVLLLPHIAQAQVLTFTGNTGDAFVYNVYSPTSTSFLLSATSPTVGTTTTGNLPVNITMASNLGAPSFVSAPGIFCGTGCFMEAITGTSKLFLSTGTTTPTIYDNFATISGLDIYGTPGSKLVDVQLVLNSSSTGTEYLNLTGTASFALSLCNAGSFMCTPTSLATNAYFNSFVLTSGWSATLSTNPYGGNVTAQPLSSVYLNSLNVGKSNVSWVNPPNPWLLGSTTGTIPTVPNGTALDVFVINNTSLIGNTTVNFDEAVDPLLNSLTIDSLGGATGPVMTLNQSAGVLSAGNMTIGSTGTSVFNQSGGTLNVPGTLTLNGYGTYALGGTLNAGTIQVNPGGVLSITSIGGLNFSALNIAGGTVTGSGIVGLDYSGQSNKTYTITQSGSASAFNLPGTNSSLYLGVSNNGTYLMQGGSVNIGGDLVIGQGSFQQTSGNVTVGGTLNLSTGYGSYTLSGTNSQLSAANEIMVSPALLNGSIFQYTAFTQNGGLNSTNNLTIGSTSPDNGVPNNDPSVSQAVYALNNGTLTARTINIGSGKYFQLERRTIQCRKSHYFKSKCNTIYTNFNTYNRNHS